MFNMSARIFRLKDEWIQVCLTIFFILVVLCELFIPFVQKFARENFFQVNYVASLILFEALHVLLTFLVLLFVPEMKKWISERWSNQPKNFWLGVVIVISAFTLILFVSGGGRFVYNGDSWFTHIVSMSAIALTLHHRLSQTKGISLAYGLASLQPEQLNEKQKYLFRIQNHLYLTLLLVLIPLYWISYRRFFLHNKLDYDWSTIRTGMFVLAIIASGIILAIQFIGIYIKQKTNKNFYEIIFNLRLFFYVFVPFSFFSVIAMETLHGFEYVFLWRKMGDQFDHSKQKLRPLIVINIAVLIMIYYTLTYGDSIFGKNGVWTDLVFAFVTGITLTHFLLDRTIFRMRNPVTRKIIGPLLIARPKS